MEGAANVNTFVSVQRNFI